LPSSRDIDGPVIASQGVRPIDVALIAYARAFEHPSKIRIVRWLVRRLAAGRLRVRYTAAAVIAIDPADFIGWAVFKSGSYEPASLSLALRIMADDPGLFVDVGSNFGWYTCAVGALAGSTVVSIEPDCENCASLRANIALNGLDNVMVFNGAVGANFDAVRIARRSRGNAGTSAVHADDAPTGSKTEWVATIALDALLERIVRPPARPILVKIDVEGFEPQVLAGLDLSGPFRPKNVIMEFDREVSSHAAHSFDDVRAFFAASGYELLDITGHLLNADGDLPEHNLWARDKTG